MISSSVYTYSKKVPQEMSCGVCAHIDDITEQEKPIHDFTKSELQSLSEDVQYKDAKIQTALKFYAQTTGYELINKQMRTSLIKDRDMNPSIQAIFSGLRTYGFNHRVRLFRTESNDYQQNVNGKLISTRKLTINDSWKFSSFISTSVTNQPISPKVQLGELTVFVFEFEFQEDIKGIYLDGNVGMQGESEFLLAPAEATVTNAYKQKIGMGYMVKKVKFVVCKLKFL